MSGAFAAASGAAGIVILDTQTVTRGQTQTGTDPFFYDWSGYKSATPAIGSISDGTSNVYSGAAITALHFYQYSESGQYLTRQMIFRLSSEVANSGWATMLVGTGIFSRTDAAFTTGTGFSQWAWSISIPDNYISEGDPFTASTTVKWY